MKKLLLLLMVSWLSPAFAAAPWVLASDKDGIRVYTQDAPGQDLKNFRGVVRVNAPMRLVLAALMDSEAMPEWFFHLREARMLEVGTPQGSYMYLWLRGIWPVSDRDAVIRLSMRQQPDTLALHMEATAAPAHLPPMRDRVRIPRMRSGWVVTPVSPGVTEIQLDGNADPGGRVPVWIANLVVTKMPRETLNNLRARLQTPGRVNTAALTADPKVAKLLAGITLPE